MARLSSDQIKVVRGLISEGKSLNQIRSMTNIGKTTIYYHMRKMNGRKIKLVVLNDKDLEVVGEFIGFFAGDGSYFRNPDQWEHRIRLTFNQNEYTLMEHYRQSLARLITKQPNLYRAPSVLIVDVRSKILGEFILRYLKWSGKKVKTICLRDRKFFLDREFLISFLRGLLDADGYIRKGRKEIYYGSISFDLASDFAQGLDILKIPYKRYTQKRKNCADFYKIRLSGTDVDRFVSLVAPLKAL